MGEVRVPADALWGAQTQRSLENFPIGDQTMPKEVVRALALGADAALVCRPVVVAAHGGGQQGVEDYLAQLGSELADTMEMCGAATLADVGRGMLFS